MTIADILLEKVVTSKQLRLAVEMEGKRRARLENDAATKWLRLAMEMDEERKADCSYHTAQVGPGDRGRKKSTKRIGFNLDLDLDLTWIEIGVFFKE